VANLTGILLVSGEKLVNLLSNLSIGDLDIILGLAIISHQGKEAIIGNIELDTVSARHCNHMCESTYQLVFLAEDVGDIHVVGGWAEFFEFLASENIDGDKMNLCVTVLASLGGRHVDDLAGAVLDDDESVLSQGRALHGKGGRRAGIGGLEGVFMLLWRSVSGCLAKIIVAFQKVMVYPKGNKY
jgi:hypothetical protein